jgi:hypothetical protein
MMGAGDIGGLAMEIQQSSPTLAIAGGGES